MRYVVRESFVEILGVIWMPAIAAGTRKDVSAHDIENMRDDDGAITRDSVEQMAGEQFRRLSIGHGFSRQHRGRRSDRGDPVVLGRQRNGLQRLHVSIGGLNGSKREPERASRIDR